MTGEPLDEKEMSDLVSVFVDASGKLHYDDYVSLLAAEQADGHGLGSGVGGGGGSTYLGPPTIGTGGGR